MNWEERLRSEVLNGLAPDPWNSSWKQVPRFGGQMAVEYEVGELLAAIVRATKPEIVIETGSYKGFSTLMIASALKRNERGHLYTIDINDWKVSEECQRFELDSFVTFIKADSRLALRELAKKIQKVDFLWLDADHTMQSVLDEVAASTSLIKPGTILAFHDTILFPEERQAIEELKRRFPGWESMAFVTSRGFHLMRAT